MYEINIFPLFFNWKLYGNERELSVNTSSIKTKVNISFFPEDSEVLFFPFSSFEIKEIKEIELNQEKIYEIDLLYLGKYLKDIENDYNLICCIIR